MIKDLILIFVYTVQRHLQARTKITKLLYAVEEGITHMRLNR